MQAVEGYDAAVLLLFVGDGFDFAAPLSPLYPLCSYAALGRRGIVRFYYGHAGRELPAEKAALRENTQLACIEDTALIIPL